VKFVIMALVVGPVHRVQADWPHLRGPNYDGVATETGLADSWSDHGPPRLWSRELGQGHSGVIVAADRLFTQYQTTAGQYLVCLDPADGHTLWEVRYAGAWQSQGAYPGPYATPTWYHGKVYYTSPTGLVGCVDGETGAPRWRVDVRDRFAGKGFDFGYAATPLVEDGRVILPVGGPDAALVALDADDGRTLWRAGSDPASYCSALPITFAGRRCIVAYLQNALLVVEATTGQVLYRRELSAGYNEHAAWPLYREPHLLLTAPFRVAATRWQLQAGSDGTLLCRPEWTSNELSNDVVSSVLVGGHVYGFDLKQAQASAHRPSRGVFRCLDWSTGQTCWSTEQVGHAAVLAADGKLFLLNDSGVLILARAQPSGYEELGRSQLFEDEVCWTPPTLWQGRLFVRSPSSLVCVYVGRRRISRRPRPALLMDLQDGAGASTRPGCSAASGSFPMMLLQPTRGGSGSEQV
jgi:outer membrane protein assembly factor BamB